MSKFHRPFTVPDRTPLFKPAPRHYKGYRKLSLYCEASLAGGRIRARVERRGETLVTAAFEPGDAAFE